MIIKKYLLTHEGRLPRNWKEATDVMQRNRKSKKDASLLTKLEGIEKLLKDKKHHGS